MAARSRPVGGRDYPRNEMEFHSFFPDDRACAEYLAAMRWPDGFRCPSCLSGEYWLTGDGLYKCCSCRRETSATAGTIFDKTRYGLKIWFLAIWHVVSQKNGASALGLQRVLGFGSYETAWAWLQKLRRAMVVPDRDKLSGVVEVDETYFGGVKSGGFAGRGAPGKTMVVVAVENYGDAAGRCRMQRIQTANKPTLHGFILDNIQTGSTIITDGWWHYKGLDQLGYTHDRRVVHGSGRQAHELIPHAHRVMALSKRWLDGTHQGSFSPHHLDYYLDEFTFRFNRRRSKARGLLFYRLLEQATQTAPQPYEELLTPAARSRRRRQVQAARIQRQILGKSGPPITMPRRRPKRPGGASNRLEAPVTRRQSIVKGRRGL